MSLLAYCTQCDGHTLSSEFRGEKSCPFCNTLNLLKVSKILDRNSLHDNIQWCPLYYSERDLKLSGRYVQSDVTIGRIYFWANPVKGQCNIGTLVTLSLKG